MCFVLDGGLFLSLTTESSAEPPIDQLGWVEHQLLWQNNNLAKSVDFQAKIYRYTEECRAILCCGRYPYARWHTSTLHRFHLPFEISSCMEGSTHSMQLPSFDYHYTAHSLVQPIHPFFWVLNLDQIDWNSRMSEWVSEYGVWESFTHLRRPRMRGCWQRVFVEMKEIQEGGWLTMAIWTDHHLEYWL
jgi:hypothetical protein